MNGDVPRSPRQRFQRRTPTPDPATPAADGLLVGGSAGPGVDPTWIIPAPLPTADPLQGSRPSIVVSEDPPAPKPRKRRRWPTKVFITMLAVAVINALVVVPYIWLAFPRTAFMLQGGGPVVYQYVSLQHVSRYAIASAIAQEDQLLGMRDGAFPLSDFTDRAKAYLDGEADPTGSTIHQQLVKNIYLWPGQDPVRKGVEAVLATEYGWFMSDQRIMELYLNYAQFGPKLYGICAASWYYFNEPPWHMSEYQAAQLTALLPGSVSARRAAGGGILLDGSADPAIRNRVVNAAGTWIPAQIAGLGGWEAAVATIGIIDTASDYAASQNRANACSTMPPSVAKRLQADGF